MKMNKLKSLLSLAVVGTLLFTSCADLAVENVNDPTKEAVEGSAENQSKLLAGGFYDLSTALVSSYGTHPDMIADQHTATNNVRNYWDFSEEPRLRLPNTPTYAGASAFSAYYGGLNSSISTANLFINNIVNDGLTISNASGTDVTDAILAQAYFLRGMARGYLGIMYDQAFLIDENFEIGVDTPEFVPYPQMVDASISDLEEAITLAEGATSFTFNAMPNPADSWDGDEFIDIVNSFAAKILASEARTAAEAANTDWGQVLTYAQNGLGGPDANSTLTVFKNANIGSSGEFANYYADWANFVVACGSSALSSCSGYNPTDVKVIHTLDPNYPTEYPANEANGQDATLAAANSPDPRLGYFVYTTNAGFLNSNRNANLYSNYFSARFYAGNDWWPAEYDVVLMTSTEVQLLEAEAHVWLNQTPLAAPVLNNSPAGSGETDLGDFDLPSVQNGTLSDAHLSGGWTFTGTESLAEMQFALMREYAVEVSHLGAVGSNWFFMRRHDLLQEGSMTMFPVPSGELEVLGLDLYTFGGEDFAGDEGAASGANSWKDLANQAGLKVMSKKGSYTPLLEDNANSARNISAPLSRKGVGNN